MAELEYSNEALESKAFFYNKKITVYVEGKDDPLFWSSLFSLADLETYVESVGGKNELEKYKRKIIDEGAEFYLAMDNDNSEFIGNHYENDFIIKTYGYSIENTMYQSILPIEKMISNICRKKLDLSKEFNEWIDKFSMEVYELIVYDIANNKYQKGVSIFGDNCYRFLKNQNSHEICSAKTGQFIDKIKHHFTKEELLSVREQIEKSEKELWFLIKGHFISNALLNLIKNIIRKEIGTSKTITPDFLYSITMDCFENWQKRIDIFTVVKRIEKIKTKSEK